MEVLRNIPSNARGNLVSDTPSVDPLLELNQLSAK